MNGRWIYPEQGHRYWADDDQCEDRCQSGTSGTRELEDEETTYANGESSGYADWNHALWEALGDEVPDMPHPAAEWIAAKLRKAERERDEVRAVLDKAYREDTGLAIWHNHPELELPKRYAEWLDEEERQGR